MKLKKILSIAAIAATFSNAQTVELNSGWNNVGIINDASITELNNSSVKYIWKYQNGRWGFYSFNSSLLEEVRRGIESGGLNYFIINLLQPGDAIWVYSENDTVINIGNDALVNVPVVGYVKDYVTNQPLSDFNIYVDGVRVSYNSLLDDANENFQINLNGGEHNITIEKDGYLPFSTYVNITSNQLVNLGQIALIPENIANNEVNLSVRVLDATNGNPLSYAIIKIFDGYNNTSGPVVRTIEYRGGNVNVELPAGEYTFVIEASGYYTSVNNISIAPDEDSNVLNRDFTITPIDNNQLRVVLSWGEYPTDLDSHLIAIDPDTNQTLWHVYFNDKMPYNANGEVMLDVDDTTSYGPETITLKEVNLSVDYKYFVYNFSHDGNLSNSNANVKVYYDGREYDFNVPAGDGDLWKVFEIRNGVLIPCTNNCIFNTGSYSSETLMNYRLNSVELELINSIKRERK